MLTKKLNVILNGTEAKQLTALFIQKIQNFLKTWINKELRSLGQAKNDNGGWVVSRKFILV